MGNQPGQSIPVSAGIYNPDMREWKPIGQGQTYTIWKNLTTSEELEEYLFTATDTKEFQYMKHVFEFRHNKENVVATKFFIEEKRAEICSTFYQGHIFNERIPLRLNEIKDIPFPDSLHLVNASFLGFKELFNKVGSFSVNDHLIGINSEAKVKVWVNSDFGKPNYEGGRLVVKLDDEKIMVGEIIQVLDKIIDHRTQPESITNFISQGGSPTFEEALGRLNQYTIKHRLSIPPLLNSVAELRDRGYFKKMHPKGASLNTSVSIPPQRFTGFPLPFPGAPISPPTGYDTEIPPINEEVPFPGDQPYYEGGPPVPPFNPDGVNNLIPPVHQTNVIVTQPLTKTISTGVVNGPLRAGINYPVRTLAFPKPQTVTTTTTNSVPYPLTARPVPAQLPNLPIRDYAKPITSIPPSPLPSVHPFSPGPSLSLTPTYDSLIKNQTLYSPPVTTIPNKIQLTVTKTTGSFSDNRIITSFSIIPNQYQSSSTLDSILFHATELQRTLEQAVATNSKAVQKYSRNETVTGSFGGAGYGSIGGYDNNYSSGSGWEHSEGKTDPNLLKGALNFISKAIDAQSHDYDNYGGSSSHYGEGLTNPDILNKTKLFNQSAANLYDYNNGWGNTNDFKSNQGTKLSFLSQMKNFGTNNKPSTSSDTGSYSNDLLPSPTNEFSRDNVNINSSSNERSSPEIMALISGLGGGGGGSNKKISFADESVPKFGDKW